MRKRYILNLFFIFFVFISNTKYVFSATRNNISPSGRPDHREYRDLRKIRNIVYNYASKHNYFMENPSGNNEKECSTLGLLCLRESCFNLETGENKCSATSITQLNKKLDSCFIKNSEANYNLYSKCKTYYTEIIENFLNKQEDYGKQLTTKSCKEAKEDVSKALDCYKKIAKSTASMSYECKNILNNAGSLGADVGAYATKIFALDFNLQHDQVKNLTTNVVQAYITKYNLECDKNLSFDAVAVDMKQDSILKSGEKTYVDILSEGLANNVLSSIFKTNKNESELESSNIAMVDYNSDENYDDNDNDTHSSSQNYYIPPSNSNNNSPVSNSDNSSQKTDNKNKEETQNQTTNTNSNNSPVSNSDNSSQKTDNKNKEETQNQTTNTNNNNELENKKRELDNIINNYIKTLKILFSKKIDLVNAYKILAERVTTEQEIIQKAKNLDDINRKLSLKLEKAKVDIENLQNNKLPIEQRQALYQKLRQDIPQLTKEVSDTINLIDDFINYLKKLKII